MFLPITPTLLQAAIGVVIHQKTNIELVHNFYLTSSYEKVLHFKSSAVHAAAMSKEKLIIFRSDVDHVQVVEDNLDANISSPSGIKATHALAILLTHPQVLHVQINTHERNKIKRLKDRNVRKCITRCTSSSV